MARIKKKRAKINSRRKKMQKRGRYKIKIKGGRKESVIKKSHNLRVNHAFQAIYVEKCACKRLKKGRRKDGCKETALSKLRKRKRARIKK